MTLHAIRSACVAFCLALGAVSAAHAADLTGTWLTQNGDAHIRVAKCGANMCGTIVWLRDDIDPTTGKPPVDQRNPDPSKRNTKILGMRIFAMTPAGNGIFGGPIYSTDDGQTYPAKILLRPDDYLEIQGCSGKLCGAELWRRADK